MKHRQSVTAVALSDDDLKGFSASKDGTIMHWDVDSGIRERYQWPSDEILRSHGAKDVQGPARRHSRHILALAVSSDGRYLASGGLDRHVHLWDARTRQHIQVNLLEYLFVEKMYDDLESMVFVESSILIGLAGGLAFTSLSLVNG